MHDYDTREDAILAWQDAQFDGGCSCFVSAPCSYCVSGFSLELEEYLEVNGWNEEPDPEEEKIKAYDDAMKVL